MKLCFLGTGAADWNINDYEKGKEFRRFSSALIDDSLLIDPGPHIFHFAENEGKKNILDNVKNIIVTHTHDDHFNPENIEKLCKDKDCTLYGDKICKLVITIVLGEERAEKIKFVELKLYTVYEIDGYKVIPLLANHVTEYLEEDARCYIIEKDGRALFYGCDSGWIPAKSWSIMKKIKLNALVMECTCGELAHDDWRSFGHNTIDMLELMMKVFKKYGYFAEDVKYYTSHMARTLHGDYESVKKVLEPIGFIPAFDGMEIEI